MLLPLTVLEGLLLLVGVPLAVPLEEEVLLPVGTAVELPEEEMLPELEALAPRVRGGVGLALSALLPLTVEEGVLPEEPVPDCVALPVAVPLGD